MVDTGSKRKKGESVAESQGSRRAWRKLQRRDPCMDEEPPHGGATGGGGRERGVGAAKCATRSRALCAYARRRPTRRSRAKCLAAGGRGQL